MALKPTHLTLTCLFIAAAQVHAEPRDQFEMKVRPLLADKCWACHRQSAMGGLRLDSREAILKGGKSGAAIVPEKPADSLLIQAVTQTHERLKMPPQGKLPDEQIAILEEWVRTGAYWPPEDKSGASAAAGKTSEYVITPEQRAFWSFQPVKHPDPPPVKDATWVSSPIDSFILARLEKEGLHPVHAAGKRTLIRRATFDLTGLPPTPAEVDAFLKDDSPKAFATVVDRLLASPRYGERWGRYWLDVARYSDDRFNSTKEDPYLNSFRYRNWVISALNRDMPYNEFVKAQLAGDLMSGEGAKENAAGLGFYALSPEMQDDRVDATTRGFLGLTVACATCHDHKFDPIPTKDFYSLQGVFANTELHETPLAPKEQVDAWEAKKKNLDKRRETLDRFYAQERERTAVVLASKTADYMLATRKLTNPKDLDEETLGRWTAYLGNPQKNHPFLKKWFALPENAPAEEVRKAGEEFQELVLAIRDEKREVDEKNKITLGLNPDRSAVASASLAAVPRDRFIVWRDLFEKGVKDAAGYFKSADGLFYYNDDKVERFLEGPFKNYVLERKEELARLKKDLPEKYAFLETICDKKKTADIKISIRGDRNNLGEVAPRRFLAILSKGERKTFTKGSGRMELAEAIADENNPLTARVIVNRVWQHHFGHGIVATPSNFGQLGERPTHPELLDYLASEFMANGWSLKKLHRSILLSSTYALSAEVDSANADKDPANTLLWRANRQRLDAESLRDSILFVSGKLDLTPGGQAEPLDKTNNKRTVYGFISRRKLDGMLALFDFPNPNSTSESRSATNVPLQRLFLMNSDFVEREANALAQRYSTKKDEERVRGMYLALFGREPDAEEMRLGLSYAGKEKWPSYARILLSSNEFSFVD